MTTDVTEPENTETAPAGTDPADATPTDAGPAAEQPPEDVGAMFKDEVARRAATRDGTTPPPAPPPADPAPEPDPAAAEGAAKGAAEAPEKGAEKAAAAQADAKPDPWAGVDPALKRQYESLLQTNRSLTGRVSNQERLLNELRAAQGQGPKPAKTMSPEALTKIRGDFPELSDLVDLVEDTRQTLQTTASTVGTITDERYEQQARQQTEILAARHKDWFEIHQSPEFAAWKAANPAFGQIADTSENGAELAQVFDAYKFQAGLLTPSQAPEGGAAPKPDAGAKRAAQLETSVAVSGKAAAAPTGNGGGPDGTSALWRQEMARRAAQRSARA